MRVFLVHATIPVCLILIFGTLACSTGEITENETTESAIDDSDTEWQDFLGPGRPDPLEEDLRQARSFYESTSLPAEPLPRGLVEVKGLTSLCIEALGFPIDDRLDRDAAYGTGMLMHSVGDQTERFDEVNSACEVALHEQEILMGTGHEANARLYEIYLESQECLESSGHQTVEPPTRESFIESPWTWYPWEALLPIDTAFTPTASFLADEEYRPYLESLDDCPRP